MKHTAAWMLLATIGFPVATLGVPIQKILRRTQHHYYQASTLLQSKDAKTYRTGDIRHRSGATVVILTPNGESITLGKSRASNEAHLIKKSAGATILRVPEHGDIVLEITSPQDSIPVWVTVQGDYAQ